MTLARSSSISCITLAVFFAPACVACPPPDFDNSGGVDGADLGVLLASWSTPSNDLNGDLNVDGADLGLLLARWGPCPPPLPLECSGPLTRFLGVDGQYTLENLALGGSLSPIAIDAAAFGGTYEVSQLPPPGTILVGHIDTVVTVTVQGINGLLLSCSMPLTLIDVTPPTVQITGVQDGQELVAPASVSAGVTAHDAVSPDAALDVSVFLDGAPYLPGEIVAAPGYHTLSASANDEAGNQAEQAAVTFLIRPRPAVNAVAVVEHMTCNQVGGPGGFADLDVVMLIASRDFPIADLDIAKVALWPLDANGVPLNTRVMFVAGSSDPAGFYSYATAEAEYQQGYWRLHFHASALEELVKGCPSGFWLSGMSRPGQPALWDLDCAATPIGGGSAVTYLARQGVLNADPPAAPPPQEPCPACEWKDKWDPMPDPCAESLSAECEGGGKAYDITPIAGGATLQGGGQSINSCDSNAYGSSCTATGSGVLLVWLEGRKACCDPVISVSLQPTIDTTCNIWVTGSATITPTLDEKSDCGGAAAKATGTHVRTAAGINAMNFSQSDLKSCGASMATITVASQVTVDVTASKTQGNGCGLADANVKRGRGRITVNAVCATCSNSPFTSKQGF